VTIKKWKTNTLLLAVKSAAGIAVITGAAQAGAQSLILEEVIVTAQKRSESLQDVPIAVTAISGEKILEAGIQGLEDLTAYVPNVVIFTNPDSNSSIFIRGIGSGNNRAFEQSVGMFIDGIYSGRQKQFLVPFMDVGSVEVLKGPQGALFGKNTVAGAMIVNSARPTDELEGELRAQYEIEYGSQDYFGVVSGPLTDNLSGRLAGKYQKTEGYMDNLSRGSEEPEIDNSSVRGSLLWDASETVQVYAKVDYSEQETIGNNTQLTNIDGNFRGLVNHRDVLTPQEDGRFDDKNTQLSWNEEATNTDSLNAAIQLDWDLNNGTLTSLTGYSEYDSEVIMDGDTSDLLFLEQKNTEDFEQISQEFRLASPGGETVDYIVGVYLESQEMSNNSPTDISLLPLSALFVPGSPVPPVELTPIADYEQESDTMAVFGQLTWRFAEEWSLTGGLRYSKEEKEASLTNVVADFGGTEQSENFLVNTVATNLLQVVAGTLEDDRSTDNWSYSANLAWDFSDDGMTYLRYARGYKTGGFNPNDKNLDPDIFEYGDEEVNSVELGAKMTLLDGAASLNMAAFYTEMTDLQVSSFVDNGFIVGNAAESTSKGFEVEGRWQAAEFLNFALAVGYLDSEYDDFPGAPCTSEQLGSDDPIAAGCEGWTADNPGLGTTNLKGETAGRSPEWTGTFITNLFLPVGDAIIFKGSLDVLYEDELNSKTSPNYQDSYTKINARVALADVDSRWEVAVIGKNLTDETTFGNGFGAGFFSGSWAKNRQAPRTVAAELVFRF
jgi:iron complex outermembrane recepter protein